MGELWLVTQIRRSAIFPRPEKGSWKASCYYMEAAHPTLVLLVCAALALPSLATVEVTPDQPTVFGTQPLEGKVHFSHSWHILAGARIPVALQTILKSPVIFVS
jgi:hypothetical protein